MIAAIVVASTLLVEAFGSASSSRTFVVFLLNVMLVVSMQAFIGNSGDHCWKDLKIVFKPAAAWLATARPAQAKPK